MTGKRKSLKQIASYLRRSKSSEKRDKWTTRLTKRKDFQKLNEDQRLQLLEDKRVLPKEKKEEKEDEEIEQEVWEVESQHSYQAESGTEFNYRVGGVFANKPKLESIENMIGKSMPSSFHNSAKSGRHRRLPKKLYSEMLTGSVKGVRVEKKIIRGTKEEIQTKITNQLWGNFEIKSKGGRWGGENGANKPYFA